MMVMMTGKMKMSLLWKVDFHSRMLSNMLILKILIRLMAKIMAKTVDELFGEELTAVPK